MHCYTRNHFTLIPQDEGTRICLMALFNFYENRLPFPLPLGHLRQMFDFILKYNYFGFDDKFYLQIHGTQWVPHLHQIIQTFLWEILNTKHCKMHQTIYNHSFGNASLMTYSWYGSMGKNHSYNSTTSLTIYTQQSNLT